VSVPSVTRLSVTAIKGLRVHDVGAIDLQRGGARGDRQFFLIDANDRMVNGKQHGALQEIETDFDPDQRHLRLTFPNGTDVAGELRLGGGAITATFFSRQAVGRLVPGPWSEAISDHVGASLRLVESQPDDYLGSAVDRGFRGAVSLISAAAMERLAEAGNVDAVDARRFRMLIEVDGLAAHAEDGWVGRTVRIGDARIHFHGHVGRCVVTTRGPDTGIVDFPTLKLLAGYRRDPAFTEEVCFGIHGEVLETGRVTVGDVVEPDG
jgi:hypothetical protein